MTLAREEFGIISTVWTMSRMESRAQGNEARDCLQSDARGTQEIVESGGRMIAVVLS
jgi:hypothetical protein